MLFRSWANACTSFQTIAIKTDGTIWAWGSNFKGQLGQSNVIYRSSPVQVGALTTWSKVNTGSYYNLAAVKTDGTLWIWGGNDGGQLGQNNRVEYSSPIQVGALTNWSTVTMGSETAFATKTDGTLWAWGRNQFGQLGINNTTDYSSPKQVGALTNWLNISCGNYHANSVKTDGTMWTWGDNRLGQLGLNNRTYYSSPKQVGADTTWVSVMCLSNATFGLRT